MNLKPDLQNYEAILLDIGNVIFYDFPIELAYSFFVSKEVARLYPEWDPTPEEILLASRAPSTFIEMLGSENRWRKINAFAWGRTLKNWDSLCAPIPGAIETLRRLSRFRIAIVANQPRETKDVLKRFALDQSIEKIILDAEAGISKPDPALYLYAADALGLRPESLLMIGDRIDNDILPAKSLGITTIWINQFPLDETLPVPFVSDLWRRRYFHWKCEADLQQLKQESSIMPDYTLGRLADLLS